MNAYLLISVAIFAGALIPVQAGINGIVGIRTGFPVWATTLNFIVGTVALLILLGIQGQLRPFREGVSHLPWWAYLGGLLGAGFVTSTVYLAPRLGAASMLASLIAGQMIAALMLDHLGVLGYPQHPIGVSRILGVLLLVLGVALIRR